MEVRTWCYQGRSLHLCMGARQSDHTGRMSIAIAIWVDGVFADLGECRGIGESSQRGTLMTVYKGSVEMVETLVWHSLRQLSGFLLQCQCNLGIVTS
jgi:hypothetical protein